MSESTVDRGSCSVQEGRGGERRGSEGRGKEERGGEESGKEERSEGRVRETEQTARTRGDTSSEW